jgi:predicted Zn-dependent protease
MIPHLARVLSVRLEMTATSKRLDFLVKLTSSGKADAFAWYGLAMEYRSLERHDEALAAFESLRSRTPDYVPMYLMCGQMLEKVGRLDDARAWLTAGIDAAQKKGDAHAASELESALAALG